MKTVFFAVLMAFFLVAPAQADTVSAKDLVGRWDLVLSDGYLRLFDDGTFRLQMPKRGAIQGTYRLLTGSAIELNIFVKPRNLRVIELKYMLKGDHFYLRITDRWMKYERAK